LLPYLVLHLLLLALFKMDFEITLNGCDYRDIDESDSESDDDGPDLFEPPDTDSPPPSPFDSSIPQQSPSSLAEPPPSASLRTILPGDKPPLTLSPPPPSLPARPKSQYNTVGARIQALTL
jgi:hypothetical protein